MLFESLGCRALQCVKILNMNGSQEPGILHEHTKAHRMTDEVIIDSLKVQLHYWVCYWEKQCMSRCSILSEARCMDEYSGQETYLQNGATAQTGNATLYKEASHTCPCPKSTCAGDPSYDRERTGLRRPWRVMNLYKTDWQNLSGIGEGIKEQSTKIFFWFRD